MEMITTYLIPVLALTILAGFWVAVQLLARKVGTKNHIENAGECGNGCTCMGVEHCKKTV